LTLECGWCSGRPAAQSIPQHRKDFSAYLHKFEAIRPDGSNGLLASLSLKRRGELESHGQTGSAAQFIQEIGNCNSRKVFRTKKGSCGLGPRIGKPEDLCSVLIGSHLPMLLQKQENQSSDKFLLVGECILQGFMNYEAVDLYQAGKLKLQEFSIVLSMPRVHEVWGFSVNPFLWIAVIHAICALEKCQGLFLDFG
jgi:hypothetical protein